MTLNPPPPPPPKKLSISALQVERLSGFVQNMDDAQMIDREFRLSVINSTVNVDIRSSKLYDLVEKDLLGPLDMPTAAIAPYR